MNRKNLLCLGLLLLPTGFCFAPPFFGDQTPAYRDSARFYYRQFEWNRDQWQKGEVPLWNSRENLGEPVVSEASSSVFYPLQVLFLIPGLPFHRAFVLYAALHVYLAGVGAFLLARGIHCRHSAALLCGIGYSMGGSLVFQTCNLVFLVGGSWLPFAVWMSWWLSRSPGLLPASLLAVFLALPILGGDPQTAYHAGMISGLILFAQWRQQKAIRGSTRFRSAVALHLLSALLAIGLAAIQVLPSWNATRNSTRSEFVHPRSIYEMPAASLSEGPRGILGRPVPGTHHDHLYQFSQPPWSLPELVWPNISGSLQPHHARWADSIPAAGRTWTPSIYCGLLPFAFFTCALFRRQRPKQMNWIRNGFLIFALGSLGWFGGGWLLHELSFLFFGSDPARSSVGAPAGGIYWFLVVFLPGYVNFRYPAKLFVVASLLLCLLAAREFHRQLRDKCLVRFRRFLLGLMFVSGLTLLSLWLAAIPVNNWFFGMQQRVATEFGPFDQQAAWKGILFSILHALLASSGTLLLINQGLPTRLVSGGLVLLCMVDLLVANGQLNSTARSSLWNRNVSIVDSLPEEGRLVRIYRTRSMIWSGKNEWLSGPRPNRIEQIVDWENQTLMPRHHLGIQDRRIGVVESFRSIEDYRFASLMAYLDQRPGIRTQDSFDLAIAPDPIALGVLSCQYLLIPRWGNPNVPESEIVADFPREELLLVRNPWFRERFRLATNFEASEPVKDLVDWLQSASTRKMLHSSTSFAGGNLRPIVEEMTGLPPILENGTTGGKPDPPAATPVTVIQDRETVLELKIQPPAGNSKATTPRLLVIADRYDEDWIAYSIDRNGARSEIPIHRANLVMRGILLRPADQHLLLLYRPRLVILGAWLSLVALLVTAASAAWSCCRPRWRSQPVLPGPAA